MSKAIAILPCLALAAPLPAQGLIMVADLDGLATLDGVGKLALLDQIGPNQRIRLEKGARMALLNLQTGEELDFQGPCRLQLDKGGRISGATPVRSRQLPGLRGQVKLGVRNMVQATTIMRGGPDSTDLELQPGGPVLLEPAPAFSWRDLGPGATYHFKLFDAKGELQAEFQGGGPGFSLPSGKALVEGERYTWTLEGQAPGEAPLAGSGRLRLLAKAQRTALDQARPAPGASFAERVVHAALLEEWSVRDEARNLWRTLARERPGDERLKELASR